MSDTNNYFDNLEIVPSQVTGNRILTKLLGVFQVTRIVNVTILTLIVVLVYGCGNHDAPDPRISSESALIELIDSLEPWHSDTGYSREGWQKLVRAAGVIQEANPEMICAALNKYTSRPFRFHDDYEDASKPFLLLRMAFKVSAVSESNQRGFRHWRHSGTNSTTPPPYTWPIGWSDSTPCISAAWMGSDGQPYPASEEFRLFLGKFPFRDLREVHIK